jgi:hypothetical protein
MMETGKENAGRLAEPIGDPRAVGQFEIERRVDQILRHLEEFLCRRRQFGRGQPQWPSSIALVGA